MNDARLWAPWRSGYITGKKPARCIFCAAVRSRDDATQHVLYRGRRVFSLLNRFPYNAGHVMVAPIRHVGRPTKLTRAEYTELFEVANRMMAKLDRVLRPHGYNLGINVGRVAGAGLPGHLHLHVVPRWNGDTNFMPVVGSTKVLSETLDAMHARLRARAR